MTNDKVQNQNGKKEQFWHLSIGISIAIGIFKFGICPRRLQNLEVKYEDNT